MRHLVNALTLLAAVMALFSDILICPFQWLFEVPCPSCGLSRAVAAFATGNWACAFGFHPLFPLALVALTWWMATEGPLRTRRLAAAVPVGRRVLVAVAAVFVAFWVGRGIGAFGGPVRNAPCGEEESRDPAHAESTGSLRSHAAHAHGYPKHFFSPAFSVVNAGFVSVPKALETTSRAGPPTFGVPSWDLGTPGHRAS